LEGKAEAVSHQPQPRHGAGGRHGARIEIGRDAVAQILAYMGDLMEDGTPVSGLLVAPDFDPRAVSAARAVPGLRLVRYGFSFSFQPVGA